MKPNLSSMILVLLAGLPSLAKAPLSRDGEIVNYTGSSFNEVLGVVEDRDFSAQNQEQLEQMNVYKSGKLPQYEVSFKSMGGFTKNYLSGAAKATIADHADYYQNGFNKFVHANGVCMSGDWKITEANNYSGYFAQGSQGLIISRVSVAGEDSARPAKGRRAFGLSVKLFPTINANEVVKTANIFTIDVLSGTDAKRYLDVATNNHPKLIFNVDLIQSLAKIFPAFKAVDSSPTYRPITEVSQIGLADGQAEKSPLLIRLRPDSSILKNDKADFRAEVLQAFEENSGVLKYAIEVSDFDSDVSSAKGWKKIGQMTYNKAMLTFGCDKRIHFNHPKDDKRTSKKKNL